MEIFGAVDGAKVFYLKDTFFPNEWETEICLVWTRIKRLVIFLLIKSASYHGVVTSLTSIQVWTDLSIQANPGQGYNRGVPVDGLFEVGQTWVLPLHHHLDVVTIEDGAGGANLAFTTEVL